MSVTIQHPFTYLFPPAVIIPLGAQATVVRESSWELHSFLSSRPEGISHTHTLSKKTSNNSK